MGTGKRGVRTFHVNMLAPYESPTSVCLLTHGEPLDKDEQIPSWNDEETEHKGEENPRPLVNPELEDEQRQAITRLLERMKSAFSKRPGRTNLAEMTINTGTAKPVFAPSFRVPHALKDTLRQEVAEMQKAGLVLPSRSPWGSPVILVPKKDGTKKLCVDFRKINTLTTPDPYPIPRIDAMIDELAGASFISVLDMTKGYWQVPVAPESQPKMAFVTSFGKFEFKVMPFGLTGAPAVFQRLMNEVLADMTGKVAAYMDDVVIYSATWEEHLQHVQEMLDRIWGAGLTLKASKCRFGMRSCEYLGHEVGEGKVKPMAVLTQNMRDFAVPKNKKQVRAFLGLSGYYQQFIPYYATIATPLSNLTKKDLPDKVQWKEEHQQAFDQLKEALVSEPVLQGPRFNKRFHLQTDASDVGVGTVLSQKHEDGTDRPVAFFSKKLTKAECNYATVEWECMAIVKAIDHFSVYLTGVPFTVVTDHLCLQYL